MKTPTHIRLEFPSADHQQKADNLRKSMHGHPERVLEALIRDSADAWKLVEAELAKGDHVYAIRVALEDLYHNLHEAFKQIFYTEVMLRIPRNAEEEARRAKDKPLLHQVRRLYNLTGRIVHNLQKEHSEPLDLGLVTPMTAEFAELIAGCARWTLGPLNDDRYHYPDRQKWIAIHARTRRRLANLWLSAAQADEQHIALHGSQAQMR